MDGLTPTAKSSFIAGVGLSIVAWSTLWHIDSIASLFRVNRWIKRDKILGWMNRNKTVSLVATEGLNFGVHGVSNPNSTTFALGATIINAIMIYAVLPLVFNRKTGAKPCVPSGPYSSRPRR